MVNPQRVDHALGDQTEHQLVGLCEHLGVLLTQAGEVVDVEEATVPAGLRVEVEEALAQLGVGPEAVALVSRHVVGDEVENDPEAGVGRG